MVWKAEFEPPNAEIGRDGGGAYRETLQSLARMLAELPPGAAVALA
jgi:hypothetical protein